MRLTSLHTEGFRAAPDAATASPDTLEILPSGPTGIALLDGLTLVAGACQAERTNQALVCVGLAPSADAIERLDEAGLPVHAVVKGGDPQAIIDPAGGRLLRLRATFELDPPLFGSLRQHAVRDPRLVSALSDASLTLGVGLLWTTDLTTVSIDLLGLTIGGQPFSASGPERPPWLPELLHAIAGRIRRAATLDEHALATRLHEASLSSDPDVRQRFDRIRRTMALPPFGFGTLELVRIGGALRPCFGPHLLRVHQLGPGALSSLNLVSTVFLDEPDILLAATPAIAMPPAAIEAWLTEQTQGDDAVLEQILIARGGAPA